MVCSAPLIVTPQRKTPRTCLGVRGVGALRLAGDAPESTQRIAELIGSELERSDPGDDDDETVSGKRTANALDRILGLDDRCGLLSVAVMIDPLASMPTRLSGDYQCSAGLALKRYA
jgi:hypothetical protein